ncbi:peptidoglycan-binding protein [Micromonospora sp. WMMA1949]|uniref:peptidoglycan-binding protein n=1 Tax=unclassified Micromonospora TaxID=2617518 RepID=UPI0022B60163|nr:MULTISPECIES: peptidoglycan-binding protein [unclassified Micromonospora]MCZ7425745.1 peptidoglycan-binding protein [Micromonospora sp. WMMA1949]WBC10289.1 peptidoglycan-binding protein [Micromonospora sp. WMMA1947]
MSGESEVTVGGRRRRRRMRTWLVAGAGMALLAVAAAATLGLGTRGDDPPPRDPRAGRTVQVTRGDLVEYTVLDGTVGYGAATPVRSEATGTVTWLAAGGTVVKRGRSLLRVDEKPVVLMYGPLPMYRTLAAPLEGRDVEQFERNLRALGYSGFSVDQTFSSATTNAVKRWQRDLGREETGRVEPGQVLFAPGAVRIARHSVRVGATVPAEVFTWTGTDRLVTAAVAQADAAWATPGAKVSVTLPDGRSVPGVVHTVGDDAAPAAPAAEQPAPAAGDGETGARVPVTVEVNDQKALQDGDAGAVEVRRVSKQRRGVLTVPVSALLALAEGGYGLEVVDVTSTRVVAVEVGMFADGRVEVTGVGLDAGMNVRIPQ